MQIANTKDAHSKTPITISRAFLLAPYQVILWKIPSETDRNKCQLPQTVHFHLLEEGPLGHPFFTCFLPS